MTKPPIYLDYMATTPIDPRVIEKMLIYMGPTSNFGNPSSVEHTYGQHASVAIEVAREQLATCFGTQSDAFIFTSGATEANNLAILGSARFYQRKGKHAITLATEHKTVLDSFAQLEREGFEVTYLKPDPHGLLDLTTLKNALRPDTILVSIMHVNNEIGVIQNIAEIGELLRGQGIIFHVDAAQSAGKLPINLNTLNVDLMSFSAHKIYGPKGIGALYIRQKPRIRLTPLSFGGGQEHGLRAGTLATHQIVGMGEALALAEETRTAEQQRLLTFRNLVLSALQPRQDITINGSLTKRLCGHLSLTFHKADPDHLLTELHKFAVSTRSACASQIHVPSYVLSAIGLSPALAARTIRLAFGRYTVKNDVDELINNLLTMT